MDASDKTRRALRGAAVGDVAVDSPAASPVKVEAFPVKVEAIVAFVTSPESALRAIVRHVTDYGSTGQAEEFNEGVRFSFSYGGLRHDVTITNETPA